MVENPVNSETIGVIRLDSKGHIQSIDHRCISFFQLNPHNSYTGLHWLAALDLNANNAVCAFWNQQKIELLAKTDHFKIDNKLVWFDLTITPICTKEKITSYVVLFESTYHPKSDTHDSQLQSSDPPTRSKLSNSSQYEVVFAHAPVGMYEFSLENRILRVNKKFCELTGYLASELVGQPVSIFTHPDDILLESSRNQALLSEHQAGYTLEKRCIHKQNHVIWTNTSVSLVKSNGNESLYFIGIVEDITTRKNAENAVTHSKQIVSAVLDSMPVLIAYLDSDMNFVYVNRAYAETDQKPASYFVGKNHFDLFPHAENEALFRQAVVSGNPCSATAKPFEYEHNPERGVTHWDWTLTPIKNSANEVTGLVLALLNVTERVKAIESAEKNQRELKILNETLEKRVIERTSQLSDALELNTQIVSTSTIGIGAYHADGRCIFANEALATHLGKSATHVDQLTLGEIDGLQFRSLSEVATVALKDGQAQRKELHIQLGPNSDKWFDCYFARFFRHNEPHLLVITNDISDRKRAQLALQSAKDEAEAASNAKSDFLSRVSHELRTPLNAILGFAQVLEMEKLDSVLMDYVQEIHRAGDHLLDLIDELLDLSRIESGKLTSALQPVDLQTSITASLLMIKPWIDKLSLSVSTQDIQQVTVLADPIRLRQIFVNLLSNAAKYNRPQGHIGISTVLLNDGRVRVAVRDTGIGIPLHKQAKIFRPFERLDAEFSGIEGTGIGLALSKQLAELMGARMSFTSAQGVGSTFWIEIPVVENGLIYFKPPSDPHRDMTQPGPTHQVLYIEDDAANMRLVEAIFRHRSDLRLFTANSWEQGMELAEKYHPDLILLDIHLPGKDGYAILKELQELPETAQIPVVALSADAMPIDIERGIKAGFKAYLTKPVRIPSLMSTMESVLTKTQTTTS